MKINAKQFEAVMALPREKRYRHFIKVIVGAEEVWGLYSEDWATALTDKKIKIFPLWPAREYAQACAINEWSEYAPKSISLSQLTENLLPNLTVEGISPGIFFTPNDEGVVPKIEDLLKAIEIELEWY